MKKEIKPYKPNDTIEDLFINFFEEHHREMMFRTHGHWISRSLMNGFWKVLPFSVAKLAAIFGTWDEYKNRCAVSIPRFTISHAQLV